MSKERITVTIDVDTDKVRSRAVEDSLVEILSQWQADGFIADCDIWVEKMKENEPCQ